MRRALLPFLAGCLALSAFAATAPDWPNKPTLKEQDFKAE